MAKAPPSRKSSRRPRFTKLGLWTTVGCLVLLAAFLGVLELSRPHVSGDRLRFDTYVDLVEQGRIKEAKILDEDAYVVGNYERDDRSIGPYNLPVVRTFQPELLKLLVAQRVPTRVDQQVPKRVAALASILLPGLILVLLFVYLIISFRRGSGLFSVRSGAKKITADQGGASFADVAGHDAAITELREIKEFLSDPSRYAAIGASVPKGVLLYGPPGCGKTLLARALANEAGASFYSISGSDFVELYVGVGAARVRDLFREARQNAPALIFIDELDSIGRSRGSVGHVVAHGEQEQSLNQVLSEMDGFSPSEGIIVLAATNRPDVLDPALLRPGRFDRTIALERPDERARLAILQLHARDKRLEGDVDLAAVARRAIGLTGADLASVMNEGALLAARAGKGAVSQVELDQALQRILEAPERQRRLSLRERSVAKRFAGEEPASFADVGGVDDAIEELAEVKDYLSDPDRFARAGARVPRGVLLAGPPGCGKTLLARAVASEANAAFFSVAASEFVEVFAGEGASRVRELFAEARASAPAIVFIDEVDAIGGHRSTGSMDGHREREQTLNQILVELDGFEVQSGVIVMAATNRPDMLDAALVRPGRFDRRVTISLPDRAGRRAILELHARGKHLAQGVDLEAVAGLTQGFSGADLANALNEGALLSARRGLDEISLALIEEGIDRTMMGVASRGTLMSEDERRMVAYHETGHALVALAVEGATPPHKISIIPRGTALGRCTLVDTHDRVVHSQSMMMANMAVLLGGRAAEEIVFGELGAGAGSDLERVSDMAQRMVRELGMSKAVGPLAFGDQERPDGRRRSYSDDATRIIDAEVRRLVTEAEERARAVLTQWRPALDRVAEELLDNETLSVDQVREITDTSSVRRSKPATTKKRGPASTATSAKKHPPRPESSSGPEGRSSGNLPLDLTGGDPAFRLLWHPSVCIGSAEKAAFSGCDFVAEGLE
jgi:cell division protease FtsH